MTTTAAVARFIETLIVHFPRRETSEADDFAWAKSMNRNLQNFPPKVLEKAAETIIDTRGYRQFHWLPKECKEVCFEAQRILNAGKPQQLPLDKKFPEFSEERIRLADEMVMGVLGRRAAKEGWIVSLHDFARNNMRLPTSDVEFRKCISGHREFSEAYARCIRGECGPLSSNLVGLGDQIIAKRERLRAMVLDGVIQ